MTSIPCPRSVRAYLRAETANLHEALDRRSGGFDFATESGRRAFLQFMLRGLSLLEGALERGGAAQLLPEWPTRTRAHLLRQDLGMTTPVAGPVPPTLAFDGTAQIWGGLYVLEGSRLGARAIRAGAPGWTGSAFLTHTADDRFWPEFVARLERAGGTGAERDGMAEGATRAFLAFQG